MEYIFDMPNLIFKQIYLLSAWNAPYIQIVHYKELLKYKYMYVNL